MRSNRTNAGSMPLDDYVQVVAQVYGKHDKHRSLWDVWLHALHHAAGIAEQIRRNGPHLHREIADFSLWFFTALLKLKGRPGDLESGQTAESLIKIQNSCSDLLWHRYPKCCPRCHTIEKSKNSLAKTCSCSDGAETEKRNKQERRELIIRILDHSKEIIEQKPNAIDEWQGMFEMIFGSKLSSMSVAEIALHLMEELGEASDAMVRMYTYKQETFTSGE